MKKQKAGCWAFLRVQPGAELVASLLAGCQDRAVWQCATENGGVDTGSNRPAHTRSPNRLLQLLPTRGACTQLRQGLKPQLDRIGTGLAARLADRVRQNLQREGGRRGEG